MRRLAGIGIALPLLWCSLAGAGKREVRVNLEFDSAALQDVLAVFSKLTKRNFILPDRLRERTLSLHHELVTAGEAWQILLDALNANDLRLEQSGSFLVVVEHPGRESLAQWVERQAQWQNVTVREIKTASPTGEQEGILERITAGVRVKGLVRIGRLLRSVEEGGEGVVVNSLRIAESFSNPEDFDVEFVVVRQEARRGSVLARLRRVLEALDEVPGVHPVKVELRRERGWIEAVTSSFEFVEEVARHLESKTGFREVIQGKARRVDEGVDFKIKIVFAD